jgi:hypothetical protein
MTHRIKFVCFVILFCSVSTFGKNHPNVGDYPLTAHVISIEGVDTTDVSPVRNNSTGVITGSVVSGDAYQRVEFRIDNKIYITEGRWRHRPAIGTDLPAKIVHHHRQDEIDVLATDKKGKAVYWKFRVTGQRENPGH